MVTFLLTSLVILTFFVTHIIWVVLGRRIQRQLNVETRREEDRHAAEGQGQGQRQRQRHSERKHAEKRKREEGTGNEDN